MDSTIERFRYPVHCGFDGCRVEARYKVAAPWSNGPIKELKTYALACDAHREPLLQSARLRRSTLTLADGELGGDVGVYILACGKRDSDLSCLTLAPRP
jgi:hypothetical protein